MRIFFVSVATLILFTSNSTLQAQRLVKRSCSTDAYGTRTCTEYFENGRTKSKTDRIVGMPANKYIGGVRQGKCMPSPSGACGGE